MVHSYSPTYYSSLQDSIASLCKNLLPFSFNKKKRLTAIAAAEQSLSKQQADNLKWQQESFHQILKLMGLCKEGIVPETEVSAFKSYLLDTLIASPHDHEHSTILRDKLVFLQELLYAKCVSEDEYHSLKRPLLQRLAVQGAEIEAKDIYVGAKKKEIQDDEWSVIDLKDEKAKESSNSKHHSKQGSAVKQIKGAASILGFGSSSKSVEAKEEKGFTYSGEENIRPRDRRNEVSLSTENPFWNSHNRYEAGETKSILKPESLPYELAKIQTRSGGDKPKRKPFRNLFQKEQHDANQSINNGDNNGRVAEDTVKSGKKPWGLEGFKKWKKNDSDDETLPLALNLKSSNGNHTGNLVQSPVGEGPDTKKIKRKLHPDGASSDFFVDKVLGENIKKKLSQIKSELKAKNPNVHFSDDQIDAISSRLPVDKADLKMFFPKSWCDTYGDVVLDVVRTEFKDHVGEMSAGRREKNSSNRWTTFDDDENCHPNLFASVANIGIE